MLVNKVLHCLVAVLVIVLEVLLPYNCNSAGVTRWCRCLAALLVPRTVNYNRV